MIAHEAMQDSLPVPSSSRQYRMEIAFIEPLGSAQEEALVEQARAGSKEARTTLVEQCAPYIEYWARRYFHAYSWQSWRIDLEELIGWGNFFLATHVEQAMQKEEPIGYLKKAARLSMIRQVRLHQSLIVASPNCAKDGSYPHPVDSLDLPLDEEEGTTLGESIPAPVVSGSEDVSRFDALYQAIEALTPKQRETIKHVYGLDLHAPGSLAGIASSRGQGESSVRQSRDQALNRLRALMPSPGVCQDVYTARQAYERVGVTDFRRFSDLARAHGVRPLMSDMYRKEDIEHLAQVPKEGPVIPYALTPSQRQQLQSAAEDLQGQGRKISYRALAQAARINDKAAKAYLREQRSGMGRGQEVYA